MSRTDRLGHYKESEQERPDYTALWHAAGGRKEIRQKIIEFNTLRTVSKESLDPK